MDTNKEIIIAGSKSKLCSFICKYPLLSTLIVIMCWEAFAFLCGADINHLLRGLMLLLIVFLPAVLLMYALSNKWCYRIELDKSNDTIIFYRLCNRAVQALKFKRTNIVINSYCHIFIGDCEYILHANYIHDLVSFLPKDTVIEYKGQIGKYKEKHWLKGPLIPGNKL
jgi:hypothetical protein